MLPHFAVVGHELGHAIQDRIKPDFSPHQQALLDAHQRIMNRLTPLGRPFGSAEILRAAKIVDNWTNELKADAVGYCLVGPAFFFALFGFLELAGRSYGIGPTHPPSDLRRDVLFKQLGTGTPSFRDTFHGVAGMQINQDINSPHLPVCPAPTLLFKELLMSKFDIVDAAICVELTPYARQIASTIFAETNSYLRNLSPDLIYEPTNLKYDLSTHLKPLCELIPPIEFFDNHTVKGASLASILNVGWPNFTVESTCHSVPIL